MPIAPQMIGRLIDQHAGALALYARQICREPEDAVQRAFIKLAAQKVPPDAPLPWLYRVVRNEALAVVRGAERRRSHERKAADRKQRWFVPATEDQMDGQLVAQALEDLPIDQREIVTAHVWGGLTFDQVAALVGTSSSTAHRRYQSALAALRERIGEPCRKND